MTQKWWDADPQARRAWDKESGVFWGLQGVLGLSLLIRAVVLGLSAEGTFWFRQHCHRDLGSCVSRQCIRYPDRPV